MPFKPKTICKHPGCGQVARDNGYCNKHNPPEKNNTIHNLYDRDWRRESKIYLAEHPWCTECMKKEDYTPATVVDHIKPHRGNRGQFWDKANWQGLCKHHHDQKTARGE